jgi:phage shock protein A
VQFLENEKRRHLEKIQGFNEATELTRKELENYETKYKELEEERNNLDQLITVYQ